MTRENDRSTPSPSPVRRAALLAGPLAAAGMIILGPPDDLSPAGWHVAAVGVVMAVWWMSEAVPLAATALLPLVLFPALEIQDIEAAATPYADPLIFLFLGGFLLARAMQVWHVDRHLAYAALGLAGTRPATVLAAVMAVTAFLSMWISNTATAMVMLPIGMSIVRTIPDQALEKPDGFAPALMLGIAYAATIGGMGTLVGTPPNALFAAYMKSSHGVTIGFAEWMAIGVPLVLVLLPVTWIVLTRFAFPGGFRHRLDTGEIAPGTGLERGGWLAASIMALAALAWLTRPFLQDLLNLPGISDAGISVACALLLFVLPAGDGRAVLGWREAKDIRWDVLILFGGGLSLAEAIGATDLSSWIGAAVSGIGAMPVFAILLAVGAAVVLIGELASNTATAAVFLPVAAAVATALGEPAIALALPVALFATLGFMLPVATPPNAIVFATEAVTMNQMVRTGALLDALGVLVVSIFLLVLAPHLTALI